MFTARSSPPGFLCLSFIKGISSTAEVWESPLFYSSRLPVVEHPAEAAGSLVSSLFSLHLPLPASLSLCCCLSPSPFLTFPVISPLLLCSPDLSPGTCTLLSVNFFLLLPKPSLSPKAQHDTYLPSSLTPPCLRRSLLACSLRAHPTEALQKLLELTVLEKHPGSRGRLKSQPDVPAEFVPHLGSVSWGTRTLAL